MIPFVSDDWFRSTAWDSVAREEFEKRLRRAAPSNRQHYLRIKALSLLDAGRDDDAIDLLHRSIGEGTYFFDIVSAWESLGGIAARRGRREEAIHYYRRILTEQPSLSGTTGVTEIALAEILLNSGQQTDIDEALTLLDTWMRRAQLKFNSDLFRWHLARIQAAELLGDRKRARESALIALELADRGPQLPHRKDVGLVQTDKSTLRRLKRLSK
jgi:predicted Zn-dependent protease